MTEDTRITSPVTIGNDSKERVAFDLMSKITKYEKNAERQTASRKYFITLYNQCLDAVYGVAPESILKEE